tara:strand:- start:19219 stop:20298 length:1080 start_codon:yes stop_codon:yes gene_type:complete
MNKGRLLIIAEKEREVYHRFSVILNKHMTVNEFYIVQNPDKPPFLLSRWIKVIKYFNGTFRTLNPDKVLVCGGSLISVWLFVFLIKLFKKKTEIIFFRYDIENFRLFPKGFIKKFIRYLIIVLEKFCFLSSHKFIHKGFYDELKMLKFYNKIKNKPHYLFRDMLDKSLIQKFGPSKKLSKSDKEIHVVYVGGLNVDDGPDMPSFWKFIPKITDQKIHFHVYSRQPRHIINKLKETEKNNKYFHYEGFVNHRELIKKMGMYDFSISIVDYKNTPVAWQKSAFGFKILDSIMAGILYIAPNNLTATAQFLEKNKVGMCYDYSNWYKIKHHISKIKVKSYQKNFEKYISNYNENGLIDFILN